MSNDNTKDWANIRIEEPVRDEAREVGLTYSDIMRLGLGVLEHPRVELGDNPAVGRLIGEVQLALDDDGEGEPEVKHHGGGAVPSDLKARLARIEDAATTAEARTGTIERKVDELGGGR